MPPKPATPQTEDLTVQEVPALAPTFTPVAEEEKPSGDPAPTLPPQADPLYGKAGAFYYDPVTGDLRRQPDNK